MDCGENSKQNLWYLTLYCCILSQNALIPAFLAHKKCGDDAKTTTWCISGGGGGGVVVGGARGGHRVYFTTVNIVTLHINITFKSPFHFSNNIIMSEERVGRKQHIKFHNTTPKFPPVSTYVLFYFSGGCISHRSSRHSFPSQTLPTQ